MRLNTSQTLALNLDSHIVIDAGAGTGKTTTLRVIESLLDVFLNDEALMKSARFSVVTAMSDPPGTKSTEACAKHCHA